MQETVRTKDEEIYQKNIFNTALDIKALGFERTIESLAIQKEGLERAMAVAQTVARDRAA